MLINILLLATLGLAALFGGLVVEFVIYAVRDKRTGANGLNDALLVLFSMILFALAFTFVDAVAYGWLLSRPGDALAVILFACRTLGLAWGCWGMWLLRRAVHSGGGSDDDFGADP